MKGDDNGDGYIRTAFPDRSPNPGDTFAISVSLWSRADWSVENVGSVLTINADSAVAEVNIEFVNGANLSISSGGSFFRSTVFGGQRLRSSEGSNTGLIARLDEIYLDRFRALSSCAVSQLFHDRRDNAAHRSGGLAHHNRKIGSIRTVLIPHLVIPSIAG